ncbi:T9SS type B sorting domain-containing protein [Mesonia aquimarina]|uniref:T9SS type B sorting domain-containing protein n=1 Tax=Mesonia aquimarina TaxID=1504967 RepID=UPI0013CF1B05|nr:gliding motility-associated C-terminal domain-containing protein [Mesonia aquimarina]
MKKNLHCIMLFMLLCIASTSYAQLETAHWFFYYGGVDFSSGVPVAKPDYLWSYDIDGGTSVSTSNGDLLFHGVGSPDSMSLINANGDVMQNGSNIRRSQSLQQSIAIPDPGNTDRYYVFRAAGIHSNGPSVNVPLLCSLVDMTLDGGLGGVVDGVKNIPIDGVWPLSSDGEGENEYHTVKVTATYHANNQDIWVLTHRGDYDYDNYYTEGFENVEGHFAAFLVTANGVQTTPVVSDEFPLFGGHFRISPNGRKIAATYYDENEDAGVFALFDFNTATGEISNPQKLMALAPYQLPATQTGNATQVYGVEFSPDSKRLYITMPHSYVENNGQWEAEGAKLFQYNLDVPATQDIINSKTLLWHLDQLPYRPLGGLQLAVDGKIYIARHGSGYLSTIEEPNRLGVACDFQLDSFDLNLGSTPLGFQKAQGNNLPQFMPGNFQYEMRSNFYCLGDQTQFQIESHIGINAVTWDFGDPDSGSENSSTELTPTHVYTQPGTYTVTAEVYNQFGTLIQLEDEIIVLQGAEATTPDAFLSCGGTTTAVFDLTSLNADILDGQNSNTYTVSYHEDENGAENDVSVISPADSYESATGTVYARVTNTDTGCYAVTPVALETTPQPAAPSVAPIIACDTEALDGITTIDLTQRATDLQENQPNTDLAYFESQGDADNNTNAITDPTAYTNTSNPQSLYVRISNSSLPDCYAVALLDIEVEAANLTGASLELMGCSPFDLTDIAAEVDSDLSLDYYASEADATANTNVLEDPTAYVTSGQEERVYVRLTDSNGCAGVVELILVTGDCKIPEGISPNGDGANDSFDLSFLTATYGGKHISIFNRNGRVVYETNNYSDQWFGQDNNGNNLPTGTYYYVLELAEPHPEYGGAIKKWVYVQREL